MIISTIMPRGAPTHHCLRPPRTGVGFSFPKCLPQTVLRSDEWYNDYAVKAGIGDIIGTRLFDSPSCTVILSAHWDIYQAPVMAMAPASLRELTDPLSNAARLLGWKSAAALRA